MTECEIRMETSIVSLPIQFFLHPDAKSIYPKIYIGDGKDTMPERKKVWDICEYCRKQYLKRVNSIQKCCSVKCGNLNRFKGLWSEEDMNFLIENYSKYGRKELALILHKKEKQIDYIIRKYHSELKKQKPSIFINCDNCGKSFKRYHSLLSSGKWGNFCSRMCRGKFISKNIIGERHQHWKGGGTLDYGTAWKKIRNTIRKRDRYRCRRCRKKEGELEEQLSVHHVVSIRANRNTCTNRLTNLVSLCRKCHIEVEYENVFEMWEAPD